MKHVRTAVQLALSASLLAGYVACSDEELEPARVFSDGGTSDAAAIGPAGDSGGGTGTDSSTGTDATTPTDASPPPKDAGKKHDAGDGGQDAADAADASDAASATDAPSAVVDAADDGG